MAESVDCVVVGAGVVGLAVARALALAGREVLVIESAPAIGSGVSSRSSEVIHAGMYYPKGSLKARLCVRGRQLLYAYCAERGVGHRRCGKLIVATAAQQQAQLNAILDKGLANGVDDLRLVSAEEAQALEPALACVAALHSPSTGIVDSHGLMLTLQGDLEHAGGIVAFNTSVAAGQVAADGITLRMADGTELHTRTLVNAAGLGAIALADALKGLDARHVPTAHYAKGNYFQLSGVRAPFGRLVYPMPESSGGLGVHLTLDLGGQARFGPDVQWVSDPTDLVVDPARANSFYAEIRRYWPALPDGALVPAYAGMRPKIHGPGEPVPDFVVQGPQDHGVPGLVNLFGIESPGLTSSLAIGEYVADLLAGA
jgi:L-2-hydroxyglutarate oxidase LhgO